MWRECSPSALHAEAYGGGGGHYGEVCLTCGDQKAGGSSSGIHDNRHQGCVPRATSLKAPNGASLKPALQGGWRRPAGVIPMALQDNCSLRAAGVSAAAFSDEIERRPCSKALNSM